MMSKKQLLIVTAALILSNAMVGLDGTIINTALPAIVSDMNGISSIGWIVAIFLLGEAASTPIWSKFGERIGNKHAYILATVLFAMGSLLQGLAPNIEFLIGVRLIMGIGCGGMNAIPFIIYADIYPDVKKRSQILGLATASFSTASIIGPLLGGWIVDTFSWHWVFFFNIPIALISIFVVGRYFKPRKRSSVKSRFDSLGAILLVSSLSLLLVGLQFISVIPLWQVAIIIIIALGLLTWFVRLERKIDDPILPIRLFTNRALVLDFALFAIIWGGFVAFNVYVPMWAQTLLAASAIIGGMTQIPSAITNFLGSELVPTLRERMPSLMIVISGIFFSILAFLILIFGGINLSFGMLMLASGLVGLGIGFCFNVLQVNVQEDAENRDVPAATSFSMLIRLLAQTFTSVMFSLVFNQTLSEGVQQSNGQLSLTMLNNLTSTSKNSSLTHATQLMANQVMYHGFRNIMIVALFLLVIALVLAVVTLYRQRRSVKLPAMARNN